MDILTRFNGAFGQAVGIAGAEVKKRSLEELAKLAADSSSPETAWAIFDKISAARGDGAFPDALRSSRLSQAGYDDCLALWEAWPPWPGDGLGKEVSPKNQVWRKKFIYRLKNQPIEWRDIMRLGTRKLGQETREKILDQFDEAGADPLNYLNLCGVRLLDEILSTLGDTEVRVRKIRHVAEAVREREKQTQRALERLKQKLSKYESISRYSDTAEMKKHLADFESAVARHSAAVAKRVGLKEAGSQTKRRPHIENEFVYIVNLLLASSCSNMTAANPALPAHWIKSILPAVTCVLKAAFPDWFKSSDPQGALRKVKACWPRTADRRKNKIEIYLPDWVVSRSVEFCHGIIKSEPPIR